MDKTEYYALIAAVNAIRFGQHLLVKIELNRTVAEEAITQDLIEQLDEIVTTIDGLIPPFEP